MRIAHCGLKLFGVCVLCAAVLLSGCSDSDPAGSATISGTVESFETDSSDQSIVAGVVQGVTVHIDGPVTRKQVTDADGTFKFSKIPGGAYAISLELGETTVPYRADDGSVGTVSVEEDWELTLTGIQVSEENVTMGIIATADSSLHDSPGDDLYDSSGDDTLHDSAGDDTLYDSSGDDQITSPDDNSEDEPVSNDADVNGTWKFSGTELQLGNSILVQSGITLSGTSGSGDSIAGTVNGSAISIKIVDGHGCETKLKGHVNGTGMSGSWERMAVHEGASQCTGADGSWSATLL